MTQTAAPQAATLQAEDALATLQQVMLSSDSDTARIAAAKALLERLTPKEDDEATKRAAEERDMAFAEARGMLAEFAAAKLAGLREPGALDQTSAAAATDAAGQLARLADTGGQGMGQD